MSKNFHTGGKPLNKKIFPYYFSNGCNLTKQHVIELILLLEYTKNIANLVRYEYRNNRAVRSNFTDSIEKQMEFLLPRHIGDTKLVINRLNQYRKKLRIRKYPQSNSVIMKKIKNVDGSYYLKEKNPFTQYAKEVYKRFLLKKENNLITTSFFHV